MKKYTVQVDFEIGSIVYLKTDKDKKDRLVRSYQVKQSGIEYELICERDSSWHYDFEITEDKTQTTYDKSEIKIRGFDILRNGKQ